MMSAASRTHSPRGFTLIELLVAVGILALMAALAWRGLDGMVRAQEQLQQRNDQVLTLQAALGQWGADWDAVAEGTPVAPLQWDGRSLRLVRRSPEGDGLVVVAWSARADEQGQSTWWRWQSVSVRQLDALRQAWSDAGLWTQSPTPALREREALLIPLAQWQIYFHRGGTWTNPLSTSGATPGSPAATPTDVPLPDGVRLMLELPAGQALSGRIERDWARANLSEERS